MKYQIGDKIGRLTILDIEKEKSEIRQGFIVIVCVNAEITFGLGWMHLVMDMGK